MEVRKFQANTIQEAVDLVKERLGPDALILSTRKIPRKSGISAYKSQDVFEISATTEGTNETGAEGKNSESLEMLKSELMTIKEIIFLLSRSGHLMGGFRANPEALELYAKLIRGGIAEPYAQSFLERAGAFTEGHESLPGGLHQRVLQEVAEVIDVNDPFPEDEEQVVAAFVGPTGVGKTTTIAKLAADLTLKRKRSVGLISIDNYRIGALDQIKAYARILGVPCFPAFTSEDLQSALNRMHRKDVVLIDTAGQSHYDAPRTEELNALIGRGSIKSHLLLSAGTNELEMDIAAKNFGQLHPTTYVFTKTDEVRARGVIINQLLKRRMPISFVATGQRVPEDIFQATKTNVLRLIFE